MAIQSNFPAIKPSLMLDFASTKQLDPRITFTRASTATFYNGVTTAMAEQNLVTYSQEFDNAAWSSFSNALTRTANQTTAPDGTTTADSIVGDGTTNIHYFGQLVTLSSTSTYAFSFYAKANGLNYVQVFLGAGTSFANFDITSGAGVTGTSGGQFGSLAIQDAGSGWFRCSLIMTNPSSSNVYFCLVNSASATRAPSIAVSTGIYLWGAQAEQRSAVSAYTATTTQAITNYIPKLQTAASGVARFDNNPTTGESLGLLIEESRANLLTYSSQFDNAAWTKTSSTITADTIVAPDGTLSSDKIIVDNSISIGNSNLLQNISKAATATTYTYTIYSKVAELNAILVYVRDTGSVSNRATVTFSLSSGAISTAATAFGTFTSASATSTSVGNGWYRFSLTFTSGTETAISARVYPSDSVKTTGDGYSGLYIWGAQFEAGAFATSYIPTVASQVTRAADAASMTGTNFSTWFNQAEGTIYSEVAMLDVTSTGKKAIYALNMDSNNYIHGGRRVGGASVSANQFFVVVGGAEQAFILNSSAFTATNTFYKSAGAYKVNDFAQVTSNGTVGTDALGTVPSAIGSLSIGNATAIDSASYINGTIKKIAYYPLRVTNTQLQALTS